jgi:hypothetical protein
VPRVTDGVLLVGEEAVDDFFESVGRVVSEKGVELGWRRRDACEIEVNAAEQRGFVSGTGGFESTRFEPGV